MQLKTWTKGVLILFALLFLCTWAFQGDAWARAGGGSSMGSRGSRSMSAPKPYTAPRPRPTPSPTRPYTATRGDGPATGPVLGRLHAQLRRRPAGWPGRRHALP